MWLRLSLRRVAGFGLGSLLLLATGAEAAPDARQVADSLVAATTASGRVQATYDDAAANGDAVTISGFKITRTDAKTIVIPSLVVTGAAMRDGGGFTATSIAFDNGKATRGNDVVTWTTGLVEDALIPSAEEVKAESDFKPFGKLAVTGVTISESNLAKPVTASEVRVLLQNAADGSTGAFAAQVSGIHFPAEVLKGRPQEKAILDALGYEEFDVNIAAAGAFDAASDSMTLNSLTINTAEIGTLTVTARLSDISLGKVIASQSDAEIGSETKLDSFEIRFDNDGVVERALDMHAALIWGTREDAAAQVNAALPLVLHFIGNDAFQEKVVKAFREFLVDPKSITLSASPETPVSLEKILATSLRDLDTIPDLLQADVSAN